MLSGDPDIPYLPESDGEEMLKWKHETMIRNRVAAGKEVPAVPISQSAMDEAFIAQGERAGLSRKESLEMSREYAHYAVEGSQQSMHRSTIKTFLVPELPWKKLENLVKEATDVGKD